jgi:hypothetical protein
MTISDLVSKYESNIVSCKSPAYNETQLRSDYLDPLFQLLGWDISNRANKPTNEREVLLEEALKGEINEHSKKPDYTFRLFSERKFFVEAKKPRVPVESDDNAAKQVRRYGFTAKLKISVLSNFEYLVIYDCSYKVEEADTYSKAIIRVFHYTEYEVCFDELLHLLGRESVYNGRFDEQWKSIEEKIKSYSVDDEFLNQINSWRLALGTELFQHDPTLTESQINDHVQNYLNRIIFLRVCEDRNLETYKSLLNFANKSDFKALVKKFADADKKYNSGLFDQILSEELIGNVSSTFWAIIKQLYYPESPYSFSVFSSEILGNIYEIFLSEKLTIEGGHLRLVRKPENVDRDIITTPDFIIQEILARTVLPYCAEKNVEQILQFKFADIACGSGAFLLELYQLLQDLFVDIFLATDRTNLTQVGPSTFKLKYHIKKSILVNCIYGVDKDFNAVEASKFGLLLKLLENEDSTSAGNVPILPSLDKNIICGNSLIDFSDIQDDSLYPIINPYDFEINDFDVIIGNPPYMSTEDMTNITPHEVGIYKEKYDSAFMQFDKYFLFIEKALSLIKIGGLLGYIVPNKLTKVGAAIKLREMIQTSGYLNRFISFGANQVFAKKTTYTSILILKKEAQETFEYTEIPSLRNWRLSNRQAISFQTINKDELDNEVWVLVPENLKAVLGNILSISTPLVEIIGEENISNGIQTSLNGVYVISSTREDDNFIYFVKQGREWRVEKEFTRPYYETPATQLGKSLFQTYRELRPNTFVIFPYKREDGKVTIVKEQELINRAPELHNYFKHFETDLKRRRVSPAIQVDDWYKFGRSQNLDVWESDEKIVVGVMSSGGKYPIDKMKTIVTSGGTAGYCIIALPNNSPYSLYYIQALLNSKYVEWYAALNGEVFRGGYISRGTKVLNRLPIVTIDFGNAQAKALHDRIAATQAALIQKYTVMQGNVRDRRIYIQQQREFSLLERRLDQLLYELYNLGDNDSQIPLIKDFYEID